MNNNLPFSHKIPETENNALYMVGTPIGNLDDITFRALKVLKEVSFIACEDTRQTKKIMNRYDMSNNLISFNKNNSFKKIPKIINALLSGKSVAIVSDAGMPSICDPGEDLVKKAKSLGIRVICIPGPSAVTTALASSGMCSSKFIFEGFLPKKKIEREKILFEISSNEKTTVLFESPHRIKKLLQELNDFCGGQREIQIFRELTKKFEEHIGCNIKEAIDFVKDKEILGEITIVIKGIQKTKIFDYDLELLKRELHELVNAGLTLSAASKYLAKKRNTTKSVIYKLY
ncbi:16S rRNA (cytidine(1402)-2'-O)-methyltransferase [Prochlorococcus marinus]|uniref:16S rRNA (cytidine(1402)-2'-O)-methyltransferase n=1 Tax=Prochlorococcus marinus TaxID=1219 RepID=UPI001ADBDC37|nr:16S rRNA (cytidine(1402)-2'-O)-methyltransferase [Prochlorococcus marinus]MBO8217646.1 16S rRNA (cytidine(1402)-2'-O)-methyltransferase [Prochlorococcus marinus XMU1405]MBW3040808.1 16S rRNA (cytidine(1402)-2'-O)-methyltransferase [Prochlorococcus marinus str. MU1405]MBW3048267.1 16S rRNA (cytidine(1402)-2'-O)-methyltransferase [Prochlorococcus marinus str. MU1406]